MKTAFIGLGVMGYHMAGYLQKGGYETTVYNRTSAKAVAWTEEFGGSMADVGRVDAPDATTVVLGFDDVERLFDDAEVVWRAEGTATCRGTNGGLMVVGWSGSLSTASTR